VEPATISCKLEKQADLGAAAMTRSELAREWIAALVRPESKLTRLRIGEK